MDGENGAGSQLHHPIGCRTKHRYIQGATATHSHGHQVDLRFQGELNDLRVWFSDAHRRLILSVLRPSGGISSSSCSAAAAMASSVLAGPGTPSSTCSKVSSASYSAVAEIAYFKARSEFSEKSAQKRI